MTKDIDALRNKLQTAGEIFLRPQDDADVVPNDQAGAVECLNAIHTFLVELGIKPDLLRPVREIVGAFHDATLGRDARLFRKHKRAGAPQRGGDEAMFWVVVSVAVSKLMEADVSQEMACAHVGNKLTAMGFRIGDARRETLSAASVKDQRKKVKNGRLGDYARESYFRLNASLGGEPREAAEALLASLPSLHKVPEPPL